ncbi:hypothetical protein HON22_04780 [Candidatus Peregrinibacteria bacterium]|nr:hypothetical protein [Candidatus Peregrinibacteria bacterium]
MNNKTKENSDLLDKAIVTQNAENTVMRSGLKKFKSDGFLRTCRNWIMNSLERKNRIEVQFNLMPHTKHFFQFKNGAFNLKTGLLEPRTKEMYITETLDIDYFSEQNKTIIKEIQKIIEQVLPGKQADIHYKWRGLCLTGETKEQIFFVNIGYTASNGKSTLSKMFHKSFPLYCTKLGNDAFDKNNSSAYDKAFSRLYNKPIRLVYMDEWGQEEQDTKKIKDTIEGDTITVKPLYHSEFLMKIQFKLEASSNNDPNTSKLDKGCNRRGRMNSFTSQFVDTDQEVDEANHIYKKDKSVDDKFQRSEYRLALFHLLSPYAKSYYKNGLKLPKECELNFAKVMSENDPFAEFFEEHILENKDSMESKKDIMQRVEQWKQGKNVPKWSTVKQEFQKRGFIYDSQKQQRKKKNNRIKKGFVIGCALKDFETMDDEDY